MLIRYDLCERAVLRLRTELFRLNGCIEPQFIVSVRQRREYRSARLVQVVMQTRRGLDRAIVEQMIEAIWECQG